jgi:hypothetical protein
MFDLPHMASRVFGTPLMIARAKLEVILGVLAPRLAGGAVEPIDAEADPAPATSITVERIAVVAVIGTLVSRPGYLATASGLTSYGDIGEAIAAAIDDPRVRGVILDVDSPGGEVGGLFDLVEQMRAIKAGNGKPLWAVANESALSAAYAVASATDRLHVTRTGEVGSVGVVAVHIDESGADAKAGLAWTFVFSASSTLSASASASRLCVILRFMCSVVRAESEGHRPKMPQAPTWEPWGSALPLDDHTCSAEPGVVLGAPHVACLCTALAEGRCLLYEP